ncbi:MAG TPA: hypothetical protein VIQ74_12685, partial [Gemmatimonadaceae bacterium]
MRFTQLVAAAIGAALTALPTSTALAQSTDARPDTAATNMVASSGLADTTNAPVLSLDEAISLALKSNPDYLSTRDARRAASASRRAAYGG